MAQPHQYAGEGGSAPGIDSNGVVQEGTGQSYRDSYRAEPFTADGDSQVPGIHKEVIVDTTMRFTQADGVVRQTIARSITSDPMPKVEYGRIGKLPTVGAVAGVALVGNTSTRGNNNQTGAFTTAPAGSFGSGATVSYVVTSNVASVPSVSAGGSGYQVGEILTVNNDPGVTMRVTSIS